MRSRRRLLTAAAVPLVLNGIVAVAVLVTILVVGDRRTDFEAGLWFFVAFFVTGVAAGVALIVFRQDIERNEALSDEEKERWDARAGYFPWALVAYWWRYGRR